ncbi:MAG: YjjG family noncanonical pyrimidine nucleotidase [Candidatus Gastranaerophilales bacterium]|nr:YjjG family noncanonical pyrimidine nucleotidase [Candidatus Gastranaerophilales bacterium]
MGGFSTLLWDLDGTLLDFLYAQRIALERSFALYDRDVTEEMLARYSQINDNYWKRLELGEVTKEELLAGRFRTLFEAYQIQGIAPEAFSHAYQEALGSVYRYVDDSFQICSSLRGRVKQYVVTNGTADTQLNKMKHSGLYDVMDGLFISEEIGTPKPQGGFFDYCLGQIEEKDKEKILIVGDSLTSDIKGGVQAGIATCWFRAPGTENPTEYRPDYEIANLHQIFAILGLTP